VHDFINHANDKIRVSEMTSFVYQYYGYDAYAPFRLAASVLWC